MADDESIENEDKDCIEKILRNIGDCENVELDMIKCMPGSRQGDNYMSVVKRIILKGRHGSRSGSFRCSLIIKRQIPNLTRRQLFNCDQAFNNEINAYVHVVPKLLNFANRSGLRIPLARCLFAGVDDNGEIIMLEDLKPLGYKMANRIKGLDYSHCKIVLQELAMLHATSIAAKQLYPDEFNAALSHITESIYCAEKADFFTSSLECSLKEALFSLHHSNVDGELDNAIAMVEKLSGNLYKIMARIIHDNNSMWTVVCHGDLWINNLMFKYNNRNEVDDVRLVDLQTLRYTSPVIDILHFLYTSTDYTIRAQYMDQLIVDYAQALYTALKNFEVPDIGVDSVDALAQVMRNELRAKALYGLGICMWLMPAVTFSSDNLVDLDTVTMDDFTSDNQGKAVTKKQTPEYHARMRDTVMEFYTEGILNDVT